MEIEKEKAKPFGVTPANVASVLQNRVGYAMVNATDFKVLIDETQMATVKRIVDALLADELIHPEVIEALSVLSWRRYGSPSNIQ